MSWGMHNRQSQQRAWSVIRKWKAPLPRSRPCPLATIIFRFDKPSPGSWAFIFITLPLKHNGGVFPSVTEHACHETLGFRVEENGKKKNSLRNNHKACAKAFNGAALLWIHHIGPGRNLSNQQGYYTRRNMKCLPPLWKGWVGKKQKTLWRLEWGELLMSLALRDLC